METRLFIDGKFVAGEGEPEAVLNPATGEVIVKASTASPAQVDRAVAAATRAFPKWAGTTPSQRSGMLLKLADKIESEQDEFSRLESLNCGKPYARVLADEMPAIARLYASRRMLYLA